MNRNKLILFLALTFGGSWLMAALFWTFGGKWNSNAAVGLGVLYMFVPMAAAMVVQRVCKEPLKELGLSLRLNRWFLVAWLLPPAIAFATLGVSLLLPGVVFSPDMEGMFERFSHMLTSEQMEAMRKQAESFPVHPIWIALLQGLAAGPTINAIAGFGEELGWRGLLQKELAPLGFWKCSLLIGMIWGVWHAPIVAQGHNYPQHPGAGVLMMIVWCTLLGPVFSYVRLKARSVLAAAVMHGTVNATFGLALVVVKGGNDLVVGATGISGLVVLLALDLGLFGFLRRGGGGASGAPAAADVS